MGDIDLLPNAVEIQGSSTVGEIPGQSMETHEMPNNEFIVYTTEYHAQITFEYYAVMWRAGLFNDIRVDSGGKPVTNANRVILAAFSGVFESALTGVELNTETVLDIDTDVTDVKPEDLLSIVDFMYTGRCVYSESLHKAADRLKCGSLASLLSKKGDGDLELIDEQHAVRFLRHVQRFRSEGLFLDCKVTTSVSQRSCEVVGCHRVMLCAHSKLFEDSLLDSGLGTLVHLSIDSMQMRVAAADVMNIVDFVYQGMVRCKRTRLTVLKSAAGRLGFEALVNMIDHRKNVLRSEMLQSQQRKEAERQQQRRQSTINKVRKEVLLYHRPSTTQDKTDVDADSDEDSIDCEAYAQDELLQANDDYVSIYEEYVMGPRSNHRRSYGVGTNQVVVKGPAIVPPNGRNGPVQGLVMSFAATNSSEHKLDSYGYGLPEVVTQNEVIIPLSVGDQQAMMERPFKCPHCEHRAKDRSSIQKHIRSIHSLEAPYKCTYCSMSFKVQSNLARHIRSHTGEKPYVCRKCGLSYADKKNMDAHVFREHLKTQPLVCQVYGCGARFWRHDRYAHHCVKEHGLLGSQRI